ncbi:MAG: hypothetical protein JWR80_5540 [Bradyrhizobium sp.]|nr:hypothetical protein [Bradyrhizobium sp.]
MIVTFPLPAPGTREDAARPATAHQICVIDDNNTATAVGATTEALNWDPALASHEAILRRSEANE